MLYHGAHLQNCKQFPFLIHLHVQIHIAFNTEMSVIERKITYFGCENYIYVELLKCKGASFCVHPVEVYDRIEHCPREMRFYVICLSVQTIVHVMHNPLQELEIR